MSAKKTILTLAKQKKIKAVDMAVALKYDHVNSFYRVLCSPGKLTYKRIKKLAKLLDMTTCELITILK